MKDHTDSLRATCGQHDEFLDILITTYFGLVNTSCNSNDCFYTVAAEALGTFLPKMLYCDTSLPRTLTALPRCFIWMLCVHTCSHSRLIQWCNLPLHFSRFLASTESFFICERSLRNSDLKREWQWDWIHVVSGKVVDFRQLIKPDAQCTPSISKKTKAWRISPSFLGTEERRR